MTQGNAREEITTVVEGVRTRVTAQPPEPTLTPVTDVQLAETYYQRQEIVRERRNQMETGLRIVMLVTFGGAAALQLGKDRPPSHYPVTAILVGIAFVAGIQLMRVRRGSTAPDATLVGAVGPMSAIACLAAVARVGVGSVALLPLVLLIHFFGAMDLRARAVTVYLVSAIGYLVLAVLSFAGLLAVLANVYVSDLPAPRSMIAMVVFAELTFAFTFIHARKSRGTTLQAMADLEAARGEIQKRGALLDEARLELARALGGAKVGRFTGYDVGPYAVHEVLGRGGMGDVYRAEQKNTGQPVALKVLHTHLQENVDHLKRFLHEAKICGDLDSPHIVKILDTGTASDGSPYIAMELLEGNDLASVLRDAGACSLDEVSTLVGDVCRALTVAHEAGIVHRDIKPQNLFQTTSGVWKVLDFGISKAANLAVTMTHQNVVGTPGYMSPEQASSRSVDPRSDVFSFGAVIYRALTGKPAFSGASIPVVIHSVITDMPQRPTSLVSASPDVDLVLALALAKDREQRFATAADLADAFARAVHGQLDHASRTRARAVLKERPWRISAETDMSGRSDPPMAGRSEPPKGPGFSQPPKGSRSERPNARWSNPPRA